MIIENSADHNGECTAITNDSTQRTDGTGFDIREYIQYLESNEKVKGKYICPVCSGNDLSVPGTSAVYDCYHCGDTKGIKEALEKKDSERNPHKYTNSKSSNPRVIVTPKHPQAIAISSTDIKLARLPEYPPITESKPLPDCTPKEGKLQTDRKETTYIYSETQRIVRTDFVCGGKKEKTFGYKSLKSGKWEWKKGDEHWRAYGLEDVIKYCPPDGDTDTILMVEGEKSVDWVRHHLGLVTVSLREYNEKNRKDIEAFSQKLDETGVINVIFPYDNDPIGFEKATLVSEVLRGRYNVVMLPLTKYIPGLPVKGDMVEVIMYGQEQGWNQEEYIQRLEQWVHETVAEKEREAQLIEATRKELIESKKKDLNAEERYEWNKQVRERANKARTKAEAEAILRELEDLTAKVEYYLSLKEHANGRVKWNELDMCIEVDGIAANPNALILNVEKALLYAILDEQALLQVAYDNAYNPFKDFINQCYEKHRDTLDPTFLDNLSSTLLGSTTEIENIYLKKQLIAAVARTYKPGCKKDETLILKGSQGNLKSSFLKALYGERYFTDDMSDCSDKDQLMKMNKFPGLELAEIEQYLNKKDISKTKSFLSTANDAYRVPYGRIVETHPRRGVIWGTTNEPSFLADATGSRRMWVIGTNKIIDIDWVKEHQEMIWATAKYLYDSGENWWLSVEERNASSTSNEQYSYEDPWTQSVIDYLGGRSCLNVDEPFRTDDILLNALKIDTIGRVDKAQGHRLKEIMQKLGYVYENKRVKSLNNKQVKGWYKKETEEIPQTQIESSEIKQETRPVTENLPSVGMWVEIYPYNYEEDIYAKEKKIVFVTGLSNPGFFYTTLECRVGTQIVDDSKQESQWQSISLEDRMRLGVQDGKHFAYVLIDGEYVEKTQKGN